MEMKNLLCDNLNNRTLLFFFAWRIFSLLGSRSFANISHCCALYWV